jgi:hypothetical protein
MPTPVSSASRTRSSTAHEPTGPQSRGRGFGSGVWRLRPAPGRACRRRRTRDSRRSRPSVWQPCSPGASTGGAARAGRWAAALSLGGKGSSDALRQSGACRRSEDVATAPGDGRRSVSAKEQQRGSDGPARCPIAKLLARAALSGLRTGASAECPRSRCATGRLIVASPGGLPHPSTHARAGASQAVRRGPRRGIRWLCGEVTPRS